MQAARVEFSVLVRNLRPGDVVGVCIVDSTPGAAFSAERAVMLVPAAAAATTAAGGAAAAAAASGGGATAAWRTAKPITLAKGVTHRYKCVMPARPASSRHLI
jgi:hypothetical protein